MNRKRAVILFIAMLILGIMIGIVLSYEDKAADGSPVIMTAPMPQDECFIFCDEPRRGIYQGGCQFFCDLGTEKKYTKKSPGRHGGVEWGPTINNECTLWCGEGYRQRKHEYTGPLFPKDSYPKGWDHSRSCGVGDILAGKC